MKQVVKSKTGIGLQEVPAPVVKDGYVLISTSHSLISTGSELQALKHTTELVSRSIKDPNMIKKVIKRVASDGIKSTYQQIIRKFSEEALGYSCSGTIIEKGANVKHLNVGDKVACAGTHFANHAEVNCVPKNLAVKIPDEVSFEEAAFVSLGAIAMQGVRRGDCKLGDNVAVIGLGLVGQIACQILNASGCNTIGIDIAKERVELAKKLGLEKGFISNSKIVDIIINLTNNNGADAVVVCASSSSLELMKQAVTMCRKGGKVVVVGNVNMVLPWHLAYHKEVEIVMSCSYGPGRYNADYEERGVEYPVDIIRWTETRNMDEFLNLIAKKRLNIKGLIGKIFSLKTANKAYETLKEGKLISALLKYPGVKDKPLRKVELKKPNFFGKDVVNVGLIGAGGFARFKHLPNIRKIKGYNLLAIASFIGLDAKKIAKEFDASYSTTDHKELLKDNDIDAVVVTTRHDSHAQLALDSVKAKKHVLLEKPLALTMEKLDEIAKAVEKSHVVFSVGFNRRYSNLARKAKKYLSKKKGPYMITYRVNAGALPIGHWYNDPKEGGGRIVGEASHFFDFFNWFIGKKPKTLFAQSISSDTEGTLDENNVIVTVKFEDGSIASLCYHEIGSDTSPKERIEIFKGNSDVVIDDYKDLYLDGKKISLGMQEKGHYNEMVEFLRAIKGGRNQLLDINDAYSATVCTFKVLESLRKGKEVKI